ncbi:MAG: GIY-YIG nuclease family protein [Candidatus Moranbacteria bacterium]|jgi:hypothetical protein|nr:GIY-YIG nuclease family protein [Candidatus Moranbacteria bacterium]
MKDLKGWNFIVYTLIKNNFKNNPFTLDELYQFEKYFQQVYPSNFHIKDKLRQILQNLRDKGVLAFISKGNYQLLVDFKEVESQTYTQEVVYLLSNESIPGWVKIGRTNAIDRRLKDLYNTSVPLPFKVEETIETKTLENSRVLEKSIHSIIDTLNPNLRKNTDANRREFFKLSADEGKHVFKLVTQIMAIQ